MPLRYDPGHVLGWVPKPGTYVFEVLACEEAEFQTGSRGIRLQLAIDVSGQESKRAPLRVTDRIVFSERTTWKMFDLCQSTGVRFDPPGEAKDLVGKRGHARFKVDERNGLSTLRVDRYLPAPAAAAPQGR